VGFSHRLERTTARPRDRTPRAAWIDRSIERRARSRDASGDVETTARERLGARANREKMAEEEEKSGTLTTTTQTTTTTTVAVAAAAATTTTTTVDAVGVVASTRSVETVEDVAMVGEGDAGDSRGGDGDAAATRDGARGDAVRGENERASAEETFDDAVEAHDDDEEEEDEEVEEIVVGGPPDFSSLQRSGELSRELQDEDEEEDEEEEEISREEALAAAVELIKAIADGSEPLDAGKLGSLLWAVSNALLEDLTDRDDLPVPGNSLESFPVELVRSVMEHIDTIVVALTFEPEDAVTQRSGEIIPAIGSHRVAAAEILAVLLQIGCQGIDERIATLKLPNDGQFVMVSLVRMFFKYSWSSALHATVIRLVLAALVSPHEPLWAPMFEGGTESLQGMLAASIQQALATKPISTRKGNVGSVIILANALCELQTCEDVERASVRTTLQFDVDWCAAVEGENNSLSRLNDEQAGGLCGPKPSKTPAFMDSGMGSNVISSQELLRMLQHISLGQ